MPKLKLTRSDFDYFVELETRWRDQDALGHINNADYLTYLESARIAFTKKWGFTRPPFILASLQIDYLKQLNHPATIYVGQRVIRIGTKSLDLVAGMFKDVDEEPFASSVATLVAFDYEAQTTIPVPEVIHASLRPLS